MIILSSNAFLKLIFKFLKLFRVFSNSWIWFLDFLAKCLLIPVLIAHAIVGGITIVAIENIKVATLQAPITVPTDAADREMPVVICKIFSYFDNLETSFFSWIFGSFIRFLMSVILIWLTSSARYIGLDEC